ncbi:MAG: class I SAM-dependent methyltransferase [Chromatiaceae bacterium]|nr:MAG: class I SAM-dependent methyltransferase [Chromatiaceae bacterium]
MPAEAEQIRRECAGYVASQWLPEVTGGCTVAGVRAENLEQMTFADASIDVHITQDVLEHVFDPAAAFKEIARTLKPGGVHVFTVPLVRRFAASERRARLDRDGHVVHLLAEQYHGNPVGDGRSLVTIDWGYDICDHIARASGLHTQIIVIDDISQGIRARLNEVLVTFKPVGEPSLL